MQRIIVILIAIVSITALSCIGYTILSPEQTPDIDVLPSLENAEGIYTNAASRIDLSQDTVLQISLTNEMTADGSVFLEVSERTVQYDVQPSGATNIHLQETISSGTHSICISEILSDDTVYITVNNAPFMSPCSAAQYSETLIPAVILSSQLYGNISGVDNGSSYTIRFSEPSALEEWLTNKNVTLIDARGTAAVSYDGNLENSMYSVTYQQNNITFRTTVHVSVEQKNIDIMLPEDTSQYTPISDWEAPKTLERACGFLIQADRISSSYKDSIYFQAIGDRRTQSIDLHACNNSEWSMSMTTNVSLKNDTKQDQETTYTKKELFLNGQYSVSSDGDAPAANTGISVDTVYNYFQDQLVSTIMLPKDILSAEIAESENTLRINFTGTNAFASFLTENACKILYQNPNLIAATGANIITERLECYLEIDSFSGLPIASGIDFSGHYKTEGIPYQLQYSAEQFYIIPSNTAENEIEKTAGQ